MAYVLYIYINNCVLRAIYLFTLFCNQNKKYVSIYFFVAIKI